MFNLSPVAYRRLTLAGAIALAVIIVTGGAVRLTGSGLGCPTWPTCTGHQVVAAGEYHQAVESLNRLVTGVVSALVILAVLGSLARRPRRADLVWLSLGLVVGVLAQIVLGGLVVVFHLAPPLVMGHFVVSIALLADAVVLHHRAGLVDHGEQRDTVDTDHRRLGGLLVVAAALVSFLGTVVTGSGPHAGSHGDQLVRRLPFAVHDVARLHGTAVVLFVALAAWTAWSLRRSGAPDAVNQRASVLLAVLVAQMGVGYAQYFTGVPAALVAIHIAGATAVWAATLSLFLSMRTVVTQPALTHPEPALVA